MQILNRTSLSKSGFHAYIDQEKGDSPVNLL